jgi:RNA polymerase sigma-70 factor, ECF subfamily
MQVMAQRSANARARESDREFAARVEPFRPELHAHCYRMLGSVYDADDALQETMLRAWRGMKGFQGRSSLRSWLYTIATNTCLTQIARRPKRVLPLDYGPPADPHTPPGSPLVESVWLEPYPDDACGVPDGRVTPDARYEQREGVELAFVAALQHLAPSQRAVLILREVLGFSAKEAAAMLETTVASVNSALQRARAAVEERVPERSQQETLRALGDDGLRRLVDRYVDAWERNDVQAFTAMLVEDATFAMPPLSTWYETRQGIAIWAQASPMSGAWRWRSVLTRANGQPSLAFYNRDDDAGIYQPFALNVLSFRGDQVSSVTAFIVRSIASPDPESYVRFPDQAMDPRRLAGTFERFGLPAHLN